MYLSGFRWICRAVTLAAVLSSVLVFAPLAQAFEVITNQAVSNPEPHYKDYFGRSLASMGDDRFIVGASRYQSTATNEGTAHLFDNSGTLLVTLTNPVPADNDHFGRAVAAIGSDWLAVSADCDDIGATDAGTVYLFDTNGILQVTVTNPTPENSDSFGSTLTSVGSNRLVVGAIGDNTGAASAGSVYVYDAAGGLLVTVTNPTPGLFDRFGSSLAAVGTDKFLVGVPYADGVTTAVGCVHLYGIDGTLLLTVTNPTPEPNDYFGSAVAGVGTNHFLVGATHDDTVGTNAGCAYLYDLDGTLVVTITNPAAVQFDYFGNALCEIGHERILVGALSAGPNNTGCAWIFNMAGELLVGMTNPAYGWDENFGYEVSRLGADQCLIASPYAPSGGSGDNHKAGRVYIYTFEQGTRYYVNDGSTNDDMWCTAVGDDANSGLSSNEPKASVQAILDAYDLDLRDVVYIDTGYYLLTNNITVTAGDGGSTNGLVTFKGSPAGSTLDRGVTLTTNHYAFDLNNVTHVKLEQLTVSNGFYGIYLTNADFCVVEDVVIRDAQDVGLHLCDADMNEIDGVDISRCKDGIYMFKSTFNTVQNSLVWSNSGNGIYLRDSCEQNRIGSCTVAFNAYRQVDLMGSTTSLEMENSIVLAEGKGNYCIALNADHHYVYPQYSGDYNNLYARNEASVGLHYRGNISQYEYRLGNWQNRTGRDMNSLSSDPLFADASAGDFRLKSTTGRLNDLEQWVVDAVHSPCIDAGHPDADYNDETAPNGGRRNVGAFAGTAEASRSMTIPWIHAVNLFDGSTLRSMDVGIRWNYGEIDDADLVDIEYSLDEGATWSNIVSGVTISNRHHLWTADVGGYQRDVFCRVSLSTNAAVTDANDESFEISLGTPTYYINDNSLAGAVYCTAVGNDENDGRTPDKPKATLTGVLSGVTYRSTIWIDTGSYVITNSIILTRGESIIGSPAGTRITYEGPSGEAAIVVLRGGQTFNTQRVANVIVTGAHHGVVCSDVNDLNSLTLSNLTLQGVTGDGVAASTCRQGNLTLQAIRVESSPAAGSGVYLYRCTEVVMEDISVIGAGGYGLFMNRSDNSQISGLKVQGCGAAGVRLEGASSNLFVNSLSCGNAGSGFELVRSSVYGSPYYSVWQYSYLPSDDNVVEHSTIAYNQAHGQIYEQHEKGILSGRTPSHEFSPTYTHERFGFPLQLRNSIVVASGEDRFCIVSSQSRTAKTEPSYVGNHNILRAVNGAQVGYLKRDYEDILMQSDLEAWQQAFGHDADSLSLDPLFADPAQHDYHLRSSAPSGTYVNALGGWTNFPGENSPGIDTGDPTAAYAGEPHWNGGVVNLGTYANTAFASRSADSDEDGLSDSYEQHRSGTNPNNADSDNDGASDLSELIAGTCPTNAGSVFRAQCMNGAEGAPDEAVIQWPSAVGRTYRIERALDLSTGFGEIAGGIAATPPLNTYTDLLTEASAFYRVHAENE